MEIYVVRHTEVDIPTGLCYGHLEVPLKANFEKSFKQIKKKLPAKFDKVYSSPSERCIQLADYLSDSVETDEALRELHFGDWEGVLWQEIPEEDSRDWTDDFVRLAPPNGETMLHMYIRVYKFMQELRTQNYENVLLVTHAGVIRCLSACILELPLKNVFKIKVGFNEVYRIYLNEDSSFDTFGI